MNLPSFHDATAIELDRVEAVVQRALIEAPKLYEAFADGRRACRTRYYSVAVEGVSIRCELNHRHGRE